GILHYRHYKGFPKINFGHIFFIAFIIDWHDGLTGEILFILLAGLIPELLAKSFELKTLFAYPIMIGFISIPIFLIHSNYVLIGIMSSISYYGLMFMISGITKEPMHERVLEVVLPCILNIIYFMYLAKPFYSFLDKTIY
ncbi:MAG: hypothetical protein KKF44_07850, partial [Nanoarchaeota archaeon]|nr:hypothetical protein [Nanoarchaeota archaeon]